ncbi:hypothetical protein OIU85_028046 [Salix viminalis]|uniref:Uncharacterized protein n=1 Tax=Salix viminalis TaxID=40686 RepID=A0A9Q0QK21_SALVM|nr:hypothetical protein OIU85_028046 [Salix viminalis]
MRCVRKKRPLWQLWNTVFTNQPLFIEGRDEANHTFLLSTQGKDIHIRGRAGDNRRLRREDANTFIELDNFVSKKRLAVLSSEHAFPIRGDENVKPFLANTSSSIP